MKKLYFIPLLTLLLAAKVYGQTQLGPGDLAIIGVEFNVAQHCGSTFGTDDFFAVLTLKEIENGTRLIFTDRAYLRSEDNCRQHIFRSSEGIAIFERTGGTLPAGSIFYVMFGGAPPIGLCAACSPGWTISLPTGSSPDMNTNGDQLFILQGDYQIGGKVCTPSPNLDLFEGTIIYAVSTNPTTRWLAGEAPDDCTDGLISTFPSAERSRVSYFPACFSECLRINLVSDRGYLRNLPPTGTKELLLGYITLDINWQTGPSSVVLFPTSCLDANSNVETDISKYRFDMADFRQGPITITGTGQNGIWRGLVNTNWFNACNWSNFVLPDSTIDVVIPLTALRDCEIDISQQPSPNAFATCRNLTIESALRTLTVVGDPLLRVYGNINLAGGLTAFQAGSGTVELRGPAANSTLAAADNQIDFHNLRLSRSLASKVDVGDVEARVASLLNLRRGRFWSSGTGQLTLTNAAGGALTDASGLPFDNNDTNVWIECPLQRRITLSNTDYAFPVGSPTASQLCIFNFSSPGDHTDLRLRYVPLEPVGLPLNSVSEEGNTSYNDYLRTGWWEAISTPPSPANQGQYNLTILPQEVPAYLEAKDYTERWGNASTTIAKAPTDQNIWSLDGDPVKTSHLNRPARVSRTNLSTGFSKFAIVIDEAHPFALNTLRLNLQPEPGLGLRVLWEFDPTSALAWRVQRSTGLPQFETLYEELASTSDIRRELPQRNGSYLDRAAPCDQPLWYRLEIVAADGQTTRSEIVEGRYSCTNPAPAAHLHVYPNPFSGELNLEFAASEVGATAQLELIDALGRRIEAGTRPIAAEALRWSLGHVPAGIYTLRITTPSQVYRLRVVAN